MLEEIVLQKLSYSDLVLLVKHGRLDNEEISQVKQAAKAKPIHEKHFYQLIQKGVFNYVR